MACPHMSLAFTGYIRLLEPAIGRSFKFNFVFTGYIGLLEPR